MQSSLPKRPRGGQLGNRNALKHGYYSQAFKKVDLKNGESIPIFDLQAEIVMLRLYIRRVISMATESESFVECVGLLRILSMAYTSLTRLISTQYVVCNSDDEMDIAMRQAIEELFGDRPIFKDSYGINNHSVDHSDDSPNPIHAPDTPVS